MGLVWPFGIELWCGFGCVGARRSHPILESTSWVVVVGTVIPYVCPRLARGGDDREVVHVQAPDEADDGVSRFVVRGAGAALLDHAPQSGLRGPDLPDDAFAGQHGDHAEDGGDLLTRER